MATLDNSQTIDYQLFAILKKLLIHKVYLRNLKNPLIISLFNDFLSFLNEK
ncbi:MAG: hypothetical protein ACJAYJ_000459 [Saprospiraceae bacterium]|jgi:hypothetical protein